IPTLAVESHDMIWDSPLFGRLTADRMAVSGEYTAEIYARGGAPKERLVVTGQPSLDRLVEYRRGAARLPGKAAGADDSLLLVVITQPPDVALTEETRRDMLAGAFLAAAQIPRLRVVVKPHPRESLSDLKLTVALAGGAPEAVLSKRAELYSLLAACDVVLTAFSTVGVEALYLGRPVICYKPYDGPAVLPYVDSRAVLCAKSPEEVAARVEEVADGAVLASLAEGRREYIARHECAADGGGTRRVVSLLLAMMKEPGGEG
ncbi:MAG TPA: hypothetical protein ENN88_02480, partial [Candidatus Coatesbacteria bacterium]|nr:hypothetical protein [Candidatus Coatesbacteria bacterium]